jgi:hypothetical protein
VLKVADDLPPDLLEEMSKDGGFLYASKESRLRALTRYVESAINFMESGVLAPNKSNVEPVALVKKN